VARRLISPLTNCRSGCFARNSRRSARACSCALPAARDLLRAGEIPRDPSHESGRITVFIRSPCRHGWRGSPFSFSPPAETASSGLHVGTSRRRASVVRRTFANVNAGVTRSRVTTVPAEILRRTALCYPSRIRHVWTLAASFVAPRPLHQSRERTIIEIWLARLPTSAGPRSSGQGEAPARFRSSHAMDARGDGSFVANLQLDGRGSRQAIITCTLLHQTVKAQPRRIRFIQFHIQASIVSSAASNTAFTIGARVRLISGKAVNRNFRRESRARVTTGTREPSDSI